MGLLNRTKYVCQRRDVTKTDVFKRQFETVEVVFSDGRRKMFEDIVVHRNDDTVGIEEFESVSFSTSTPWISRKVEEDMEIGKSTRIQHNPIEERLSCTWKMNLVDEINMDFVEEIIHHDKNVKKVAHTEDVDRYEWVEK